MPNFGMIDSSHIDFANGQTESRLRNMTNRLGVSVAEMIARVDGAMSAVNSTSDPLIQALTYKTTEDRVVGGNASDKVFQRAAEYTIPRPQYTEGSGWLLPLYENAISLGFTKKALDTMTLDTFERELATTVQAVQRGQRADVLEALFTADERPLDNDGTGATPGFIGLGAGSNAYAGAVPPGKTLGSYSHYYRYGTSGLEANVKAAFEAFAWFYPGATFDLIATPTILSTITSFTGFVSAGSALIRPASGTAEALVDPNRYLGVLFNSIRVWPAETQISGDQFAIFHSAGNNSNGNPLAWRYSDIWGPDAWVEDRDLYPLSNAVVNQNYGIGVNDRAAAVLFDVDSAGDYTAPTISR